MPLRAYLDLATLRLSSDSINFGFCYVGQTHTKEVNLYSHGTHTYWKSVIGNHWIIFCISLIPSLVSLKWLWVLCVQRRHDFLFLHLECKVGVKTKYYLKDSHLIVFCVWYCIEFNESHGPVAPVCFAVCACLCLSVETDEGDSHVFRVTPDSGLLRFKELNLSSCSECLQIRFTPRYQTTDHY